MKLLSIRVTNYRCVDDSGEFAVAPVTCLVGKNESGKTAILRAVHALNPEVAGHVGFDVVTDYPRKRMMEDRPKIESGQLRPDGVTTRWELEPCDVEVLEGAVAPEAMRCRVVEARRGYYAGTEWSFEVDERPVVTHLLATSSLDETDKQRYTEAPTVSELLSRLEGREGPSEAEEELLSSMTDRFPGGSVRDRVARELESLLPRFVYFDQYHQLRGRASLETIVKQQAGGKLDEGDQVLLALLGLVGTTPDRLQTARDSEQLIAELEAASASISDRIFAYWSQNRHLEVAFELHEGRPDDVPPFDQGWVFETRIKNNRHRASLNFDQRSHGFMWFFSFLVWFSQARNHYGENLVLLLDEPGLGLHAAAQSDLLRYIGEQLEPHYQVLYTTHSPFMVDPQDLLSVRTVEDVVRRDGDREELLGTKVQGDIFSTDRDTLFPLQAALGYEITQSLFIGANALLVEGPSDLLYLKWFSERLEETGRAHLDPAWTIVPVGGISKVYPFVALFGGNRLNVAVFVDVADGYKAEVSRLRQAEILADTQVFTADMYAGQGQADTEDLVGRPAYFELCNLCYGLEGEARLGRDGQGGSGRVAAEAEEHVNRVLPADMPDFSHYRPAEFLASQGAAVAAQLPGIGEAMDRFEKLFADVNGCLKRG